MEASGTTPKAQLAFLQAAQQARRTPASPLPGVSALPKRLPLQRFEPSLSSASSPSRSSGRNFRMRWAAGEHANLPSFAAGGSRAGPHADALRPASAEYSAHLAEEMALRERIETQRRQQEAHRQAQAQLQAQRELHEEIRAQHRQRLLEQQQLLQRQEQEELHRRRQAVLSGVPDDARRASLEAEREQINRLARAAEVHEDVQGGGVQSQRDAAAAAERDRRLRAEARLLHARSAEPSPLPGLALLAEA